MNESQASQALYEINMKALADGKPYHDEKLEAIRNWTESIKKEQAQKQQTNKQKENEEEPKEHRKICNHVEINVAVNYICDEMISNTQKSSYSSFIAVNNALRTITKIVSYVMWTVKVRGGGLWDHKKEMEKLSEGERWFCDKENETLYAHDIWSNIHYGYVGLAIGFGEWELKNSAGIAQIKSGTVHEEKRKEYTQELSWHDYLASFDDPKDQEAIKIGLRLFKNHGFDIKPEYILKELKDNKDLLNIRPHEI